MRELHVGAELTWPAAHGFAFCDLVQEPLDVLVVGEPGDRPWVDRLRAVGHRVERSRALDVSRADVVILDASYEGDVELAIGEAHAARRKIVVLREDVGALAHATVAGADHALPSDVGAEAILAVLARRRSLPAPPRDLDRIVGSDPAMLRLLARVEQVARTRATVLIYGETGTGKELIAAALHSRSKRRAGPFVKLNCAALNENVLESELFGHERGSFTGAAQRRIGRFEQAQGGTLFLDEISEVPPALQVKLLRFLQERELERVGGNATIRVDTRVVAATNVRLEPLVKEGRFREDLFYRLNVVRLVVPPLRERPSDIPLLAERFVKELAVENDVPVRGFTDAARRAMLAHPWPGNVRALRNAIETAVVLAEGDEIDVADLPIEDPEEDDSTAPMLMVPGMTLEELERWAILRTLRATRSVQRSAELLGISRRTIQYRLQSWGMTAKELKLES